VGAGQIADAHQELAHDLATGEAKGSAEERHPLALRARVVRFQPAGERAVRRTQLEDSPGVGDCRVDLEPVADDAGVGQEPAPLARAVAGDDLGIEAVVRAAERVALLENGEPREAGLVDLEHQTLEQRPIAREREAVLLVVIRAVPFVARGNIAVALTHDHTSTVGRQARRRRR
jgi:hypothetical protein